MPVVGLNCEQGSHGSCLPGACCLMTDALNKQTGGMLEVKPQALGGRIVEGSWFSYTGESGMATLSK